MVQLDFLIKCKFIDKITKNFKVTTAEHETPSMGHPSEPRSLESHVEPTLLLTLLSAASMSPCCWPSLRPPLFIYLFILAVPCGMQDLSSQTRDQTLPSLSQPLLGAGQNPSGLTYCCPHCLCLILPKGSLSIPVQPPCGCVAGNRGQSEQNVFPPRVPASPAPSACQEVSQHEKVFLRAIHHPTLSQENDCNLSSLAAAETPFCFGWKRSGGFGCQPGSGDPTADPVGLAAPVLLAFFFHLEKLLDWGWSRLDNKSGCVEVSDRGSPTVGRKHGSKTPGEIESQFGVWNSPSWVQVSLSLDIFKLCDTECFLYLQNVYQTHSCFAPLI